MKESTSEGHAFLRRTAILSVWTGALLGWVVALRWGWEHGAGFVFGCFWGIAQFAVLGTLIVLLTRPQKPAPRILAGLVVAKLTLYAVGFWALYKGWVPVLGFAMGFTWPLLVVLLRSLGHLWWLRTARETLRARSAGRRHDAHEKQHV